MRRQCDGSLAHSNGRVRQLRMKAVVAWPTARLVLAQAKRDCDGARWDRFLEDVLADDFAPPPFRPGDATGGQRAFLAAVGAAEPAERRNVPGSVRSWTRNGLAAVSSIVELEGRIEQFTNTRVFGAGGKYGWRCQWWRVTASEKEAPPFEVLTRVNEKRTFGPR